MVLGAADEANRERAVLRLLDYGFKHFEALEVLNQQGGVAQAEVYYGEADAVLLKPAKPVHIVLPRGGRERLITELQRAPWFAAPVTIGQPMGVASMSIDQTPLIDVPLVAMSDIKEAGLMKQISDKLALTFDAWFN